MQRLGNNNRLLEVFCLTAIFGNRQQTLLAPVNLCGGENTLNVTDLNGCEVRNSINLKEPQRDDWDHDRKCRKQS